MAPPIKAPKGFTFGADPELFVMDGDGKYVSAAGLIPGTKENPFKVQGGAVQVDGMAAEFNIDPATSYEEFSQNIDIVLRQLKKMLPRGYSLSCVPAVTFDKDAFEAAPDEAKILGCTPDYNAWTSGMNDVPDTSETPTLRCAGGHLHIGWDEDLSELDAVHVNNCFDLVKQLDWYLAAWSVRVDDCPIRRQLYGKAGACRIKTYGVEYRVLSNFWVTSATMRKAVWDRMCKAIYDMPKNFMPDRARGAEELLLAHINKSERNKTLETAYAYPVASIAYR
jgi:Phage phiEco32-like COOH.NH2 ligase-type 2